MKEIPLTRGKVALVDDEDYERLMAYSWFAEKDKAGLWYARSHVSGTKGKVRMHRLILDAKPGQLIDHKNHDGLNNQKANLRYCTVAQNQQNRRRQPSNVGYKGVSFKSNYLQKPYKASIKVNGEDKHLGYYISAKEAACAYDAAALKYFGEFAHLNFPDERTGEPILEVVKEQA